VAKRELLLAYQDRHGCGWQDPRLAALALQYHDLRPDKSVFTRLGLRRLVDPAAVSHAVAEPPLGTRAWFRGKCLARWPEAVVTANWDSLVFDIGADPLRRVPMMDPLKGTAEHTGALLADSTGPADLLNRLNS
jgi:Pup amidohydrolase